MRILLSNKFYYRRGGDCIYVLNLEELLKSHGHEVAIFAMQYPDNIPSSWDSYFPNAVKFSLGTGMIKAFGRPFGTADVKRKFTKLLNDFRPDVVHLNNVHSQLSPIIAKLAYKEGIKVVWTLHDCKLVCPRYDCMRDGQRCELCFNNKLSCLKFKCMKGGLLGSLIGYWEAKKWNHHCLQRVTDTFISPSLFMKETMVRGHYSANKIHVLCNFLDISKIGDQLYEKSNYYCFVGRLSSEKGVKTLLKVASQLPYRLLIIGEGPLELELKKMYCISNIEFVGQKTWDDLKRIVAKAHFMVLPSECYENNPLSVIEAQCLGTPVLGAQMGGIPELIEDKVNGMLFESGNVVDLKNKIEVMFSHIFDYASISKESQKRYSADHYYSEIMKIYKK